MASICATERKRPGVPTCNLGIERQPSLYLDAEADIIFPPRDFARDHLDSTLHRQPAPGMWYYSQWTAVLTRNKAIIGIGYSGKGKGQDRPEFESVPDGKPFTHPRKRPLVMTLEPIGHHAWGRTGFLIHGVSKLHPGQASKGCIVLDPVVRGKIAQSGDDQLTVTP